MDFASQLELHKSVQDSAIKSLGLSRHNRQAQIKHIFCEEAPLTNAVILCKVQKVNKSDF